MRIPKEKHLDVCFSVFERERKKERKLLQNKT